MRAEQLKGHLDALLLAVLEREPLHGYAIIEALRARSAGAFDLPSGTVYPALRRLELAGLEGARDPLDDAAGAHEIAGRSREDAEYEAVREFGAVAELASGFRTVAVVTDARRQAMRQLVGALVLAAWVGSVWHLIPLAD